MSQTTAEQLAPEALKERPPCPAPARILDEVARFDAEAETGRWDGPRYRLTYRIKGDGPPLFVLPGIASTYQIYALLLNQLGMRFRTIIYDYPGEHPDDGAKLKRITHDNLVDDVFGLIDHLNIGRAFLAGLSFGSTVALKALHREPRRFPKAAVQGAFAHRRFSAAERLALGLGRLVPGTVKRLPLRERVMNYNAKPEFPAILQDRWPFYVAKNGETPIQSFAHRVSLLTRLDLRPILPEISTEILLIQGREDRVVPRRDFDLLESALPKAHGMIVPTAGHILHLTHAELLANLIGDWLLPCAPEGCPKEQTDGPGCAAPPAAEIGNQGQCAPANSRGAAS
jgi:pimeloyl-ACP methyl ester carboxylesterase